MSATLVDTKVIFAVALESGASGVILCHNLGISSNSSALASKMICSEVLVILVQGKGTFVTCLAIHFSATLPRNEVASFVLMKYTIDGTIAVSGIAFSIVGFKIANKMGKEIDIKTVGELTDRMVSYNYIKSRRDPNTVNRRELDDVIKSIFINEFQLSPSALNKEAKFGKY